MIKYVPRFPGPIQGRAINLVKKFYPQLCSEYEFDDLLQEAYLVFMRCKELYGSTVDKRSWFMVLFSRALQNKLINLSKKTGRYISIEALEETAFPEPATEGNETYLSCLLGELPEEVKQLVAAVVSGAVADGRLAFAQMKRKYNL